MKIISSIILLIIVFITFSCSSNEGRFIILNESDSYIDSLYIMPDSKNQIIKIKKGQRVNHNIMMDEVEYDGGYFISFKVSGSDEIVSRAFGYYTNGYQIEDVINIKVLNDTILINSKFDYSY